MKTLERLFQRWQIGTTSYVFSVGKTVKENYEENLALLGSHVSFIQLLLLGKNFLAEWADEKWVEKIEKLRRKHNLMYFIHLPLDFHLWPTTDETDIKKLQWIVEKTRFLAPIGYVLHLDKSDGLCAELYTPSQEEKKSFCYFLKRLEKIKNTPFLFENTSYDLSFFYEEIRHSPFGVCFDVGHWWLLGKEIEEFVIKLGDKVRLVHVHGVNNGQDHLPLSVLSKKRLREVCWLLERYPALLEVFSLKDLVASLTVLKFWHDTDSL